MKPFLRCIFQIYVRFWIFLVLCTNGMEKDMSKRLILPKERQTSIKMVFLDALVLNPDRHTANFGLLRNQKNGEFISLAPCFDHNMALISKGYPKGEVRSDLLIRLFRELIESHPECKECIPVLTREMAIEAFNQTKMKIKRDCVVDYVMNRYKLIIRDL